MKRIGGGGAKEWGCTWEYCHASAEPLCSWLHCGTYYWCRRKFGPTGNKAASCPAPLRHNRRGVTGSGSGSDHWGRPLPCPEEHKVPWWRHTHVNSLLPAYFGNQFSIREKQRSEVIPSSSFKLSSTVLNFHEGSGREERTFNHIDVRAILQERKCGLTFILSV